MNSKQTLISILIPCYNHQEYIEESIQSIWQQNCEQMEIIAIDDGSTDNTYTILEKLQQKSPIPMFIRTRENKGVTQTLNEALALAQGKYIAVIASDDKYYPNTFHKLLAMLQEDPSVKLLYLNGRGFDGDTILAKVHHPQIEQLLKQTPCQIHQWLLTHVPTPLLTQCAIFDKEMLLAVGGWDSDLGLDDWPLNIKIFQYLCTNNFSHLYRDIDMTLYRAHDTQTNKNSVKMFTIIKEVIEKYTPPKQRSKFLSKQLKSYAKNLYATDCKAAQEFLKQEMQNKNISFIDRIKLLFLYIKYNLKYKKQCKE